MDDFYSVFEKNFRGTREQILQRLDAYDDFLAPILDVDSEAWALDLGCGRGEWLEKLHQRGFNVHGVDLDASMLQSCKDKGLRVYCQDALAYLKSQPDSSQSVVTAFHVVEHITFDQLRTLLAQAMRVLKPAGLLILETPNPENLVVATRSFYLDPTHLRPIPPELLTFLVRHAGYETVKLLRLQEDPALVGQDEVSLSDVIHGVSPDYAVVAQKGAPQALSALFANAFMKDRGIGLQTLVDRFDQFNRMHDQEFAQRLDELASKQNKSHEMLQELIQQNALFFEENRKLQQGIAEVLEWEKKSLFWGIINVISSLRLRIKFLCQYGVMRSVKNIFLLILIGVKNYIDGKPHLRQKIAKFLRKIGIFPVVKQLFNRLGGSLQTGKIEINDTQFGKAAQHINARYRGDLPMSARAEEIKNQLNRALDEQEKR